MMSFVFRLETKLFLEGKWSVVVDRRKGRIEKNNFVAGKEMMRCAEGMSVI